MLTLEKLVEGRAKGDPVDRKDVCEGGVTQDALYEAAVEYGRPFDLVANIPKLVTAQVDERVQSRLDREMGLNIIPRMIATVLSMLAFLSRANASKFLS